MVLLENRSAWFADATNHRVERRTFACSIENPNVPKTRRYICQQFSAGQEMLRFAPRLLIRCRHELAKAREHHTLTIRQRVIASIAGLAFRSAFQPDAPAKFRSPAPSAICFSR